MLAPEQIRALAYIERRGSRASADRLRAVVGSAFSALEELVGGIPEPLARLRPAADRWSVLEVVDHLVESSGPAVHQLASLLAGRDATGDPIPAGLQSADRDQRSWAAHRRSLREVHQRLLACLADATDELPLDARAPIVMVVKVDREGVAAPVHWVEHFDWKAFSLILRIHAVEHHHQIERTLAAIAAPQGRPP